MADLNDLMLKCMLDLNLSGNNAKKSNKTQQQSLNNSTKSSKTTTTITAVTTRDLNNNDNNFEVIKLAADDIDFFCSLYSASNESWADFESPQSISTVDLVKFKVKLHFCFTISIFVMFLNNFKEIDNFFDVWHKFFARLRPFYEHVVDLFRKENEENLLATQPSVREFMECLDLTYAVFKRCLVSSNKYGKLFCGLC